MRHVGNCKPTCRVTRKRYRPAEGDYNHCGGPKSDELYTLSANGNHGTMKSNCAPQSSDKGAQLNNGFAQASIVFVLPDVRQKLQLMLHGILLTPSLSVCPPGRQVMRSSSVCL